MTSVASPGNAKEALGMLRSAMGYLTAADATAMAAETQAQCLQVLEQVNSMGTAARASILGAFTSGQGYCRRCGHSRGLADPPDPDRQGTAVGVYRVGPAGRNTSGGRGVLAAGETNGVVRPDDLRLDRQAAGGLPGGRGCDLAGGGGRRRGAADLAGLAAEIYARSLPDDPGKKREQAFEDRSRRAGDHLRGRRGADRGAEPGVRRGGRHGAGCAVGPGRGGGHPQPGPAVPRRTPRALQRLVAAGLLPERAGQPVKAWVHMSLADLMMLEGSSALLEEWTSRVRAQWAGRRAGASAGGSDGGAWLDGDAAAAMACDAAMAPIVTGEVNPAAFEDLVRLCVELDRLRHHPRTGRTAPAPARRRYRH